MLRIEVPIAEAFDEKTNEFVTTSAFVVELEHSLVSLSKWESRYEKPFLGDAEKTREETVAYVQDMLLSTEIPPNFISRLSTVHFDQINEYITSKQTATTFRQEPGKSSRQIITAEVIYHWMVALQIPWEAQYWHLNRLLTLVKVCNEMNKPQKKVPRRELMQRNAALNAQRRAQLGSKG